MTDIAKATEPEHAASDGTVRKDHYGDGLQPWDLIKAIGLGSAFCIGNVIKYVSRYKAKNGLDDLKKGKWYLARMIELRNESDQSAEPPKPEITALDLLRATGIGKDFFAGYVINAVAHGGNLKEAQKMLDQLIIMVQAEATLAQLTKEAA